MGPSDARGGPPRRCTPVRSALPALARSSHQEGDAGPSWTEPARGALGCGLSHVGLGGTDAMGKNPALGDAGDRACARVKYCSRGWRPWAGSSLHQQGARNNLPPDQAQKTEEKTQNQRREHPTRKTPELIFRDGFRTTRSENGGSSCRSRTGRCQDSSGAEAAATTFRPDPRVRRPQNQWLYVREEPALLPQELSAGLSGGR